MEELKEAIKMIYTAQMFAFLFVTIAGTYAYGIYRFWNVPSGSYYFSLEGLLSALIAAMTGFVAAATVVCIVWQFGAEYRNLGCALVAILWVWIVPKIFTKMINGNESSTLSIL